MSTIEAVVLSVKWAIVVTAVVIESNMQAYLPLSWGDKKGNKESEWNDGMDLFVQWRVMIGGTSTRGGRKKLHNVARVVRKIEIVQDDVQRQWRDDPR